MSAASRALRIAELLEVILLDVDMRTVLLAQKVSYFWRDVIQQSRPLRRHLFLEHDPANKEMIRNPLLLERFPQFFRPIKSFPLGQKRRYNSNGSVLGYENATVPIEVWLQDLPTFDDMPAQPQVTQEVEESWCRMLIQQPAAFKVGVRFLVDQWLATRFEALGFREFATGFRMADIQEVRDLLLLPLGPRREGGAKFPNLCEQDSGTGHKTFIGPELDITWWNKEESRMVLQGVEIDIAFRASVNDRELELLWSRG